jgi:hypothetical protein
MKWTQNETKLSAQNYVLSPLEHVISKWILLMPQNVSTSICTWNAFDRCCWDHTMKFTVPTFCISFVVGCLPTSAIGNVHKSIFMFHLSIVYRLMGALTAIDLNGSLMGHVSIEKLTKVRIFMLLLVIVVVVVVVCLFSTLVMGALKMYFEIPKVSIAIVNSFRRFRRK